MILPSQSWLRRSAAGTALAERVHHIPRRRSRGFTLVELLIVVMIAVILLAVALPTVKYGIEEGKLREASRTINATFAAARARAAATGRHSGVWLELEQTGNLGAPPAGRVYQCTQLYLAEVPPAYTGDVSTARVVVRNGPGDVNPLNPNAPAWYLDFVPAGSSASVTANPSAIVPVPTGSIGTPFYIRFDFKGHLFRGERRSDGNFYIFNEGISPPRSNGLPDGPSPNLNAGYSFQLYRQPERVGEAIDLPRGVAIDMACSGFGASGLDLAQAAGHVLVLFSPSGDVASVTALDKVTGAPLADSYSTTVHFLVGRPENVQLIPDAINNPTSLKSNITDGSALWISISRRTGSVTTTDNAPDPNVPLTLATIPAFVERAREFATGGESKGGQ